MKAVEILKNFDVIFWDFDGVIKESVEVKTNAFEKLFSPYGKEVTKRIIAHHENNGGMSRFEKIPIYLKWAGESLSQPLIDKYLIKFSCFVKKRVIDSKWVPGALEYLKKYYGRIFF